MRLISGAHLFWGRKNGLQLAQEDLRAKFLIENYMNGTGIKGGAFGFRVSSINKVAFLFGETHESEPSMQLVDTKSTHSTTLVHFLERTVSKHFIEMEGFLEELEKPSEAYRGDFLYMGRV